MPLYNKLLFFSFSIVFSTRAVHVRTRDDHENDDGTMAVSESDSRYVKKSILAFFLREAGGCLS